MTGRYHVTVDRQGDQWRVVCPALRDHGAVRRLAGGGPPAQDSQWPCASLNAEPRGLCSWVSLIYFQLGCTVFRDTVLGK